VDVLGGGRIAPPVLRQRRHRLSRIISRAIGDRYGPFDLAFVKIGAYGPGAPWLDIHMSAEDAVRAHADVRARRLFPVHWGTFNLAFHSLGRADPACRRGGAQRERVELLTPRIGEMVDADKPLPFNPWWESGDEVGRPPSTGRPTRTAGLDRAAGPGGPFAGNSGAAAGSSHGIAEDDAFGFLVGVVLRRLLFPRESQPV
jgi:hypothetical protein